MGRLLVLLVLLFPASGFAQSSGEPPVSGPLLIPPPQIINPMSPAIVPVANSQTPILTVPETNSITIPDGPHSKPIRFVPTPEEPERSWRLFNTGETREHYLGDYWSKDELLLWWIKPGYVPPLATRSRITRLPGLGDPTSTLVLGGKNWSTNAHSGYQTSIGGSIGNGDTIGVEVIYFFLGTRSVSGVVGSPRVDSRDFIGRPFQTPTIPGFDPGGTETAFAVNLPGEIRGGLRATLSSRVTGWELNTIGSLVSKRHFQLEGLVGYRYFQFNEGLRVDQESLILNGGNLALWQGIADQIDAHNQFHGGQFGLRGELRGGSVFLDFNGKIALGTNNQALRTSGQTLLANPGNFFPTLLPGGFLVQPSNSGRLSRSPFTVLPEATVRIGLYSGRTRFYLGYNFMYLSDVIRPGDQLDRTISLGQANPAAAGLPAGNRIPGIAVDRPFFGINSSDLWVQGLMIGFETRY